MLWQLWAKRCLEICYSEALMSCFPFSIVSYRPLSFRAHHVPPVLSIPLSNGICTHLQSFSCLSSASLGQLLWLFLARMFYEHSLRRSTEEELKWLLSCFWKHHFYTSQPFTQPFLSTFVRCLCPSALHARHSDRLDYPHLSGHSSALVSF